MAIVNMSKFTLLTFQKNEDKLLKDFQLYENIHFKNLAKDKLSEYDFVQKDFKNEQFVECSEIVTKLKFIIQKIGQYQEKEKGLKGLTKQRKQFTYSEFEEFSLSYDYSSVYEELKKNDEEIRNLKQQINKLEADNSSYSLWEKLDVSTKMLDSLKFVTYILGTINKTSANNFEEEIINKYPNVYYENLGEGKDDSYVLIIFEKAANEEIMTFLREKGFSKNTIEFKDVPGNLVNENEKSINTIKNQLIELESKDKKFKDEIDNIYILLDYYESQLERISIKERFLKTNKVIIYEGFVPTESVGDFSKILSKNCGEDYYVEISDVEKDSQEVPIKLKNNKVISSFEGITAMFSAPKYNEIDPTPHFAPFYILFFGIMVGDMGYGLVLLLGTLFALKKMDLKKSTRDFVSFLFYCSFGIIFAGLIFGSFFGVDIYAVISKAFNINLKPLLSTEEDIIPMMLLSVVLGVIQIFYGLLLKGYMYIRDGKILDAVFDSLFMITTLSSAIGLLVSSSLEGMNPLIGTVCKWVLIASLIGLLLTQGRSAETIGGKIGSGIFGVYGLTSYIGDFVSYTRLVALCLSGAYVAISFNKMIDFLPDNIFVKIILGGVIVVLSQTVNIGLSLLSAYVHSSRLQYVEFFGKFYEGGGIAFSPLQLKNNHIKIKD